MAYRFGKSTSIKEDGSDFHLFRRGFNAIDNCVESIRYQSIEWLKLLKRDVKVISVNKEYSGKQVKNVTSETKYYISVPERPPVVIKLSESTILSALSDKKAQLEEFIKANKLNLKKEEDAAKLISYTILYKPIKIKSIRRYNHCISFFFYSWF